MDATLTGSGDVEVYDAYYGTTGEWEDVAGRATCMGYTNFYQTCTLYLVRFNLSYTANYSTSKRHSLGCHEFGHTVTLGHRTSGNDTDNNSCMRSVISSLRPDFDAHDISAVNDNN
ncbi:hypothetical protein ACFP3Q_09340 [Nocardioides sp. GCM10027113]|uniref:hypothetical protein n=1 Tax=unclassified Nocardioides TaxID=2615069 RepID=UPI003605C55F